MAVLWKNTFTGTAGNPDLNTLAPDVRGAGVAAGNWAGAAGSAIVLSASNVATDGSSASGNRRFTTNLGVDEYDIEIDTTIVNPLFVGIIARDTTGTGSAGRYEFTYELAGGGWILLKPDATSQTNAAPTPSGVTTMKMAVRDGSVTCSVNGAVVITDTTGQNGTTGTYAGLIVGNFSGGATQQHAVSRFEVTTVPAPVPSAAGRHHRRRVLIASR